VDEVLGQLDKGLAGQLFNDDCKFLYRRNNQLGMLHLG
jgi:hypothetical protein